MSAAPVGVGAGFALGALLGTLLPEGKGRFALPAAAFVAEFFLMAGLLCLNFTLDFPLSGEAGFFHALVDAGGVFAVGGSNGPRADAAGFGDGQAEHLRVDETDLPVEQVTDGGEQGLGREESGGAELDGEGNANMLGLETHAGHIAQGDALCRFLLRGTEGCCAQQKKAVAHLAAEFFDEVTDFGTGVEAVVFHLDEPELFFAGVVEHEVHFLAAVAEVLGVVRVERGAFKTADVVARLKVEAVQTFYAAGAGLVHDGEEGAGEVAEEAWRGKVVL